MAGNRGGMVKEVTKTGNGSGAAGGSSQQGDTRFGLGSTYAGVLVERENLSIRRNNSVEHPQANTGTLPTVGNGVRNTGKI
jgi:hypothetical protein